MLKNYAISMMAAVAKAMVGAPRHLQREAFQAARGSPARLMVVTGQDRKPRAGSVPGGLRRRMAREAAKGG